MFTESVFLEFTYLSLWIITTSIVLNEIQLKDFGFRKIVAQKIPLGRKFLVKQKF